jgi:hypothetical protein
MAASTRSRESLQVCLAGGIPGRCGSPVTLNDRSPVAARPGCRCPSGIRKLQAVMLIERQDVNAAAATGAPRACCARLRDHRGSRVQIRTPSRLRTGHDISRSAGFRVGGTNLSMCSAAVKVG